jgi:hypothetical protein
VPPGTIQFARNRDGYPSQLDIHKPYPKNTLLLLLSYYHPSPSPAPRMRTATADLDPRSAGATISHATSPRRVPLVRVHPAYRAPCVRHLSSWTVSYKFRMRQVEAYKLSPRRCCGCHISIVIAQVVHKTRRQPRDIQGQGMEANINYPRGKIDVQQTPRRGIHVVHPDAPRAKPLLYWAAGDSTPGWPFFDLSCAHALNSIQYFQNRFTYGSSDTWHLNT